MDSARSLTGRGRGGYVKTSNHNSHKQYHTDGQGNPNHGTYTDKNGKITNKLHKFAENELHFPKAVSAQPFSLSFWCISSPLTFYNLFELEENLS